MELKQLRILLADDDKDDSLLFRDAFADFESPIIISQVSDGEQLMQFLERTTTLPDVLFLDLNMPRKSGFECLKEIKKSFRFRKIPVVIYSTSYVEHVTNLLYDSGAHYYICKPRDFSDLVKVIHRCIGLVSDGLQQQPSRDEFVLTEKEWHK
jgi:CheY-like chemotaxis protein